MKKILWEPIEAPDDVVMTPQGPLDIKVQPHEVYKFEFWAGFTNFRLTRKHKVILNSINGIESLTFMSRYRFVISIGKLFSMNQVRKEIEDAIIGSKSLDHTKVLQQKMKAYKDWAIYVLPNGDVEYTTCEDKDFTQKLKIFEDSHQSIGGNLFRPTNVE